MDTSYYYMGKFEQISNKIIVSDPLFPIDPTDFFSTQIKNVQTGTWYSYVQINKKNGRCGRLFATIKTPKKMYIDSYYKWVYLKKICVDSGQAGIFDLLHYRDDNNIGNYNQGKITKSMEPGEIWYSMCSKKTEFHPKYVQAGVIPNGVIAASNWGGGSYDLFVSKKNNKIVAIKIIFMSDRELNRTNFEF